MSSVKRSLSLTGSLNEKLIQLCEELGISPNSYINNAVSKAVMQDRTYLIAQQNSIASSQGSLSQLEAFMGQALTLSEDAISKSLDLKESDSEDSGS